MHSREKLQAKSVHFNAHNFLKFAYSSRDQTNIKILSMYKIKSIFVLEVGFGESYGGLYRSTSSGPPVWSKRSSPYSKILNPTYRTLTYKVTEIR